MHGLPYNKELAKNFEKLILIHKNLTLTQDHLKILELSKQLIEIEPSFYDPWDRRYEILNFFDDNQLKIELLITENSILKNHKSYAPWCYRWFLLSNFPDLIDFNRELQLLDNLKTVDPRNFHAWKYFLNLYTNFESKISEFLIFRHFSRRLEQFPLNYSVWHHIIVKLRYKFDFLRFKYLIDIYLSLIFCNTFRPWFIMILEQLLNLLKLNIIGFYTINQLNSDTWIFQLNSFSKDYFSSSNSSIRILQYDPKTLNFSPLNITFKVHRFSNLYRSYITFSNNNLLPDLIVFPYDTKMPFNKSINKKFLSFFNESLSYYFSNQPLLNFYRISDIFSLLSNYLSDSSHL